MQEFPHHYLVAANAGPEGDVDLSAQGLESIPSAAPAQFGGPGNRWSPESLLVASVADCFMLSFRAIARASRLPWTSLECEVVGTLEREDGITRFTRFAVEATLRVPPEADESRARRILEKAEESCLVTNSLTGETTLEASVVRAD